MAIRTTAFAMAGVGCLRSRNLFGCGVVTAGVVRFVPRDPWNMAVRNDALVGVGARLGAEWPLASTWSVLGYAEATWIADDAVLRRGANESTPPAPLSWTSPPLGAAFGLGITAAF